MVSLSKDLGKKSQHCDTAWGSAEQIGILWKDDTWSPEKIVILCRDAPEGRQDTWISSPEPSSRSDLKLEKWFPLQGERTHSLYFLSFQDQNREVCGQNNNNKTYQFTQGYNILHRLQVHHLTLTFIIHNKYIIYIHTYIHI